MRRHFGLLSVDTSSERYELAGHQSALDICHRNIGTINLSFNDYLSRDYYINVRAIQVKKSVKIRIFPK
jgi:hypothetical protein